MIQINLANYATWYLVLAYLAIAGGVVLIWSRIIEGWWTTWILRIVSVLWLIYALAVLGHHLFGWPEIQ